MQPAFYALRLNTPQLKTTRTLFAYIFFGFPIAALNASLNTQRFAQNDIKL